MNLSLYNNTRYPEIVAGQMRGWSIIDLDGRNPDVDTGTDPEDVWNAASKAATQTLLATAVAMSISTSALADKGLTMAVEYLDTNWALQTITVTFDGTDARNEEPTTITAVRILRMWNPGATAYTGDAYIYETSDTVTAGVPDTAAKTHGKIDIGYERMQSTHYTIPANYTGQLIGGYASLLNAAGWANIDLFIRAYGGVFLIQQNLGVDVDGNSYVPLTLTAPVYLAARTDIKMVCTEVEADDTDITAGYQLILVPDP